MRFNYWSCSKLADAIRGTAKPIADTAEGWEEWHKSARTAHPIRYWLAEELFDKLQDYCMLPVDLYEKIRVYVRNRYLTKTHTLTSNLKRGQFYEYNTRLLHSMFDELVNFVEIEEAAIRVICDSSSNYEYSPPAWWRWTDWRCPQAGVDQLKHIIEQAKSIDMPDSATAVATQEILDLYNWWKHTRPARPDPLEASGWKALDASSNRSITSKLTESERAVLELSRKIEEQYETEDTAMMIRLVQVRRHLWT